MGIDWIRMRLKPGADREAVAHLASEQALAYRMAEQHFYKQRCRFDQEYYYEEYTLGEHYLEVTSEHTFIHEWYGSINKRLTANLDIEGDNHRIRGFTSALAIPAEWRFHAHRTFLPDEFPGHLNTWKSYVKAVESGEYQDYLRELYICHKSSFLHFAWLRLRDESEKIFLSSDAIAQPEVAVIYQEIEQLPAPKILPFPRWNNGQPIEPKQQAHLRSELRELDSLENQYKDLFRGKNRFDWFNQFASFEQFSDIRKNAWLYETIEWFDDVRAKNQGLYFYP